jgi:hypothetical protein
MIIQPMAPRRAPRRVAAGGGSSCGDLAGAELQDSRWAICRGCEKWEPVYESCTPFGGCIRKHRAAIGAREGKCPEGKW